MSLPKCGMSGCMNEADPRFFASVEGTDIPICDGHGRQPSVAIILTAHLEKLKTFVDDVRSVVGAWDTLRPEEDKVCVIDSPASEAVGDMLHGIFMRAWYLLRPNEKPGEDTQDLIDAGDKALAAWRAAP